MKLNLCCGEAKLFDFINIDKTASTKPDLVFDITSGKFPYEDNSIDEIRLSHGLEHIERRYWDVLLFEINRILIPGGKLVLQYPEFIKCVEYFITDKHGQKNYWLMCIFGRKSWPGDEHVTVVHTPELISIVESYGFYRLKYSPEPAGDGMMDNYTILVCYKDPAPQCREKVLAEELGLQGVAKSIEEVK